MPQKRGRLMQREVAKIQVSPVVLWRRIIAYFIDAVLVGLLIGLPLTGAFSNVEDMDDFSAIYEELNEDQELTFTYALGMFFMLFLSVLYWTLLEYQLGQSIGKLFTGIKVVSTKKQRLTFKQCFLRNISKISNVFVAFDMLYGIMKKHNRRYFEIRSDTIVVNT